MFVGDSNIHALSNEQILNIAFIAIIIFIVGYGICGILVLNHYRKHKEELWLKENGKVIVADVTRIDTKNGGLFKNKVQVYCVWISPEGTCIRFKSDWVRIPIRNKAILNVTVYVDRQNVSRYFVETSGLILKC